MSKSMYDNSDDESQSSYSDNASSHFTGHSQTLPSSSSEKKKDSSDHFHRKRRKNLKVTGEEMQCVVCRAPSTGYNFNVISCESCKAFFRRNALKNTHRLNHCKRGGHCIVTEPQRKKCPACRLMRCLEMGMKRELITPVHKLVLRANYRGKRQQLKSSHGEGSDSKSSISFENRSMNAMHSKSSSSTSHEEQQFMMKCSVGGESLHASNSRSLERELERDDNEAARLSIDSAKLQQYEFSSCPSQPSITSPSDNSSATNTPMSALDVKYSKMAEKPSSWSLGASSFDRSSVTSISSHVAPKKRYLHSTSDPCHDMDYKASTSGGSEGMGSLSLHSTSSPAMVDTATQHSPPLLTPVAASTEHFTQELFSTVKQSMQQAIAVMTEPMREFEMIRCNLNTLPSTIESSFNRMEASIRSLIYAFKMIPQFTLLSKQTQMTLLKQSMYGLLVFCGVFVYEPLTKSLRVTYYSNNGEKRQHYLDFETYLRRGFSNIHMKTAPNKDSAFSPLVNAASKSPSFMDFAKMRESMQSAAGMSSNPLSGLQMLSKMSEFSGTNLQDAAYKGGGSANISIPNLFGVNLEEKISLVVNLNQRIFEQVIRATDNNHMLLMALCTLRLFRCDIDSQMGRNCQYLIHRTRSELTWFITQYASHLWADTYAKNAEAHSSYFSECALQERLNGLFEVFNYIYPLEKVGTLFDQFVNPNFVSPLMLDFLSPPSQSMASSSADPSNRPM